MLQVPRLRAHGQVRLGRTLIPIGPAAAGAADSEIIRRQIAWQRTTQRLFGCMWITFLSPLKNRSKIDTDRGIIQYKLYLAVKKQKGQRNVVIILFLYAFKVLISNG